MITLLATLVLLGIAIIFHELGHFVVAKLLKIRVERFSIGMPPRLFGFQYGETDYCISAVPLGGYVKLSGMEPTDDKPSESWEYNAKTPFQRMLVVAAGPFMNFVTAYVLIVIALIIGMPTFSPVIDMVTPNTPAAQAGIQAGDVLVSINGKSISSMDAAGILIAQNEGKAVEVGVTRDKERVLLKMNVPSKLKDLEDIGFDFKIPAVVGIVQPNKPASRAGVLLGDELIAVNGIPTQGRWQNVSKNIREGKGKPVELTLLRQGNQIKLTIQPEYSAMEKAYLIGITPKPFSAGGVIRFSVGEAIGRGFNVLIGQVVMLYEGIKSMFTGAIPVKEAFGGPQTIANIAGQYIRFGLAYYFMFTGSISLTIGILNLLPIPVLDGGHIMFCGIEMIFRKPVSRKTIEITTKIGMALLVTLMVYVLLNDFINSGVLGKILGLGH
jgi:regulator of sigma E protease